MKSLNNSVYFHFFRKGLEKSGELICVQINIHTARLSHFQSVLSLCDSPTNQLSSSVTHFMQPLVETLPVNICINYFVLFLESLPPPDNVFEQPISSPLHTIPYKSIASSIEKYELDHSIAKTKTCD